MGSSSGNSLLQKCRKRLCTSDPKWSNPSLDPAQVGATCTGKHFSDQYLNVESRSLIKLRGVVSGTRKFKGLNRPHNLSRHTQCPKG
jgi:hypothetical protein